MTSYPSVIIKVILIPLILLAIVTHCKVELPRQFSAIPSLYRLDSFHGLGYDKTWLWRRLKGGQTVQLMNSYF
ncbi:hypothetical protein P3S67_006993 [Capsicum chacoense]